MVKVREDHPIHEDGSVDIGAWLVRLQQYVELECIDDLQSACDLSKQVEDEAIANQNIWAEGTSSFRTGLEMAEILAELKLDKESLVAAVLYRAVREGKLSLEIVKQQFGDAVEKLITGVLQMAAISSLQYPSQEMVLGQTQSQADNVRKMLVAMVDDVRVALIKLSERTCAIRAVKNASEAKKHRVAQEVFDIYAPLAHRLGIGYIKWELEDLSFRYLQPHDYMNIASLLDEKRVARNEYVENVVSQLQQKVVAMGIDAEIHGRAKHIYSIWRKMRKKNINFSEVYDVRAVRILVPEVKDCYAVLGIVHTLWKHIPKEFDDYIATPKPNGYQSLHTAVMGAGGKVLEVQIRTVAMHEDAELGVCAHWSYKDDGKKRGKKNTDQTSYDDKISWLRQVLDWHEELGDLSGLAEQLKPGVEQDRIYVFTPDGHVVDMPDHATPLDFAYHIHTEIGHRCRGAKVDGRIVPLTYQLKTGEQVEILTAKQGAPSRDWLVQSLGYIKSSRTRIQIQHWFKQQNREQNIIDGEHFLEKEFKRLALTSLDYKEIARLCNYKTVDDMYAAVGAGDLRSSQVLRAAQRLVGDESDDEQLKLNLNRSHQVVHSSSDIDIRGVGNLLTQIAGCCQPLPGDPIVGYITQGRGVTVHRQDCSNALHLHDDEPDRIIDVTWGQQAVSTYLVDVMITGYDRSGLLRDITAVLANSHVNVTDVKMDANKEDSTTYILLTLEVDGLESLGQVLGKINQIPNIMEVTRHRAS